MNISFYRNFAKIVELGTITAAAKELFIAQPALSKQLRTMEKELGVELITRGPKRVYPTGAGKILYDKAKRICLLDESAQKELEACRFGERGTLNIGMTPAYPDTLMENFLLAFSDEHPNIDFNIWEENSESLSEHVEKGDIEIAVLRINTSRTSRFNIPLFFKERFMVAFHKEGPWLSEDWTEIPITELSGLPLCTSRGIEKRLTECCLEAGFTPHYLSISSSRSKALMWSIRGTAVSIYVGTPPKRAPAPHLCCRPLLGKNLDTQRSFVTSKKRDLSAVAQLFLEFCKEYKQ
jgi:DNA-binding transcriptional LysR family regulator